MARPRKKYHSSFGVQLKALREAAGLSQAALAERTGMNRFSIAKIEQLQRDPDWSTVLLLSEGLGCSVADFVGVVDPTPTPAPDSTSEPQPTVKPSKGKKPGKGAK